VGRVYLYVFECYDGYVINDKRAKEIFKALTFLIESIDVNYESNFIANNSKVKLLGLEDRC
jgi:hypothetical protein